MEAVAVAVKLNTLSVYGSLQFYYTKSYALNFLDGKKLDEMFSKKWFNAALEIACQYSHAVTSLFYDFGHGSKSHSVSKR